MAGEEDEAPRPARIVLDLDWLPEPPGEPHAVTFLPRGLRVVVPHGYSVYEAGVQGGVYIPSTCGGKGTCGRCRVRVESEPVRPAGFTERRFIPREDLQANVRLSCRLRVEADIAVKVLIERRGGAPERESLR